MYSLVPRGMIHASKMKTVRTTEEELEEVARQFKEREDVVAIFTCSVRSSHGASGLKT